jgi:hypothetical protein
MHQGFPIPGISAMFYCRAAADVGAGKPAIMLALKDGLDL